MVDLPARFNHAVDENSKDCGHHDKPFEPEELCKLIWSEETEAEVDQPEDEEGNHLVRGNSRRSRKMVWHVLITVAEDRSKHVGDVACTRIDYHLLSIRASQEFVADLLTLNAIPD